MPIGFYNEIRDIDSLKTNILLPQSVYPEQYRENVLAIQGIGIYGDILMGPVGNLSYQLQYGTNDVGNDSGLSKFIESQGNFTITGIDTDETWITALKWDSPLDGLKLGASMIGLSGFDIGFQTTAPLPVGVNPQTGELILLPAGTLMTFEVSKYLWKTYSLEYMWRYLTLCAEYSTTEMTGQTRMSTGISPESETDSEGWYVSAAYRFTEWFELGTYYSHYYPDKEDKDGDKINPPLYKHSAWIKDLALTTRFDINSNWCFKLEGHSMNGTAMSLSSQNAEEDWFLFAAKMTFTF